VINAERAFLDQLALSQSQFRSITGQVANNLAATTGTTRPTRSLATPGGDLPVADSLASVVQTLRAGLGLAEASIGDQITAGKVVRATLA